jgi:hypothetical protein
MRRFQFSRPQLAVFALVFAAIGILIYRSFAAPNPNLSGDLNNDNTVNVQDLSILLSDYNTTNAAADINKDGTVNILDLSALLSHFGQSYTPPSGSRFVPGACGSGGCTASTVHGFNINVPDASAPPIGRATGEPTSCPQSGTLPAGCVTRNFQIYRPNNLLASPKPPLVIAFAGSVGGNPQWFADADKRGYVMAMIFNVHLINGVAGSQQYAFPTVAARQLNNEMNCGVGGTYDCDDIPQVQYILNALNCAYVSGGSASLCQGYNTSEVFVEGGSKGGLSTMAVACDTRTSTKIAAATVVSDPLDSTGGTASIPPNCPAMFAPGSNCFTDCIAVAPNKKLSLQWIWGSADPNFPVGNNGCTVSAANDCLGKGYLNGASRWTFGLNQEATSLFGGLFGCSQTPASTTTTGWTGKITTKTYVGCANPGVATQTIDIYSGVHLPDTWPCASPAGNICANNSGSTQLNNSDGLSEPLAAWSFWTAHYPF